MQLPLIVLLVLGALTAFGPMSIDMYLPAFPAIAQAMSATPGQVAMTLPAFFIGLAAGQLVYGPLADRFGRKSPLVVGVIIYLVASIGCAVAPNIESLIGWRFLQALGACSGMVVSRAMVRDLFDATASARVFSMLILVMGLAPILAPLAGSGVLAFTGWRAIFWALTLFGALCLLGVHQALPETLKPEARVRLPIKAIMSVYAEQLRHRRFIGFALTGGFSSAAMFAYIAGSPFVLISLHHVPESQYSLLFGMNAAGLVAASQLNARFVGRLGPAVLLSRALTVAAVMAGWLVLAATTGWGGLPGLLVPLFGFVATLGFVGPNATALALGSQHRNLGQASALLGTVQFALATASGALIGLWQDGTARPMGWLVAISALASLALFRLARRTEEAPAPVAETATAG